MDHPRKNRTCCFLLNALTICLMKKSFSTSHQKICGKKKKNGELTTIEKLSIYLRPLFVTAQDIHKMRLSNKCLLFLD